MQQYFFKDNLRTALNMKPTKEVYSAHTADEN